MNIKIKNKKDTTRKTTSLKIFIKIFLKNGKMKKYSSSKRKRIFSILSRQKNFKKVYVKVSYGKGFDASGKYVEFYNDGEYDNYQELILALRAFLEK